MLFYACNKVGTVVRCFTYETEADERRWTYSFLKGIQVMSTEYIWETFDSLFKTVYRQGRRMEELEARIVALESRLQERAAAQQPKTLEPVAEMPAERAA